MGRSKKGSRGERTFARILTKWLTRQDKELFFWRSPGSGSIATKSLMNSEISGDIISLKEESRFFTNVFSCECKTGYLSASLDKFLKNNKNNKIQEFWIQCNRDATKSKRRPLLIFAKQNIHPPWIGLDECTFNILENYFLDIKHIKLKWENTLDKLNFQLPSLILISQTDFFNLITPEIIKKEFYENI